MSASSDTCDSDSFIAELKRLAYSRCRFTVFAGAGLSVGSGIPASGSFLPSYIAYCADKWLNKSWNPQVHEWPSLAECPPRFFERFVGTWTKRLLEPEWESQRGVILQALGAMQDWRDGIEFLSRARAPTDKHLLGPPDSTVLDSFFQHVVSGREPCLSHLMLAALSEQLRTTLVLTTNFDELIEAAFHRAGINLVPFDVHLNSGLPSARIVLDHNAIIKLHGTRFGLRANLSLDLPPTEEDRAAFIGYVAGEPVQDYLSATWRDSSPEVGILVGGYSASDERIQGLFREALQRMPHLHVFWVCHTPKARGDIELFFPGCSRQLHIAVGAFDLLAVRIYQELTGTLPPFGMFFPATWNLPEPVLIRGPAVEKYENFRERIRKEVIASLGSSDSCVVEVTSRSVVFGTYTACAELFRESNWLPGTSRNGPATESLWMDLDDVEDPDEIFFHVAAIMSRKMGVQDPLPDLPLRQFKSVSSTLRAKMFAGQLAKLNWVGTKTWIVFLNGRESPGQNPPVDAGDWRTEERDSGWLRNDLLDRWNEILMELRRNQSGYDAFQITFVVITCYDDYPWNGQRRRHTPLELDASLVEFSEDKVANDVCKWCRRHSVGETNCDLAREILVYALIHFDLVRYPAAIRRIMELCEDRGRLKDWPKDWEENRIETLGQWVEESLAELEKLKMFRRKPGGFIWMNFSLRQRLRDAIKLSFENQLTIQRLISRWYGRLFISSADPRAVFAAVNHALRCLEIWRVAKETKEKKDAVVPTLIGILRHCRIVLTTAEGQLKRRLSELVTDSNLKSLCELARRSGQDADVRLRDPLLAELAQFSDMLYRVCLAVWHVEEDLPDIVALGTELAKNGDSVCRVTVTPEDQLSVLDAAALHESFVRIREREYDKAREGLKNLLRKRLGLDYWRDPNRLFRRELETDVELTDWLKDCVEFTRGWLVMPSQTGVRIEFAIRLIRRLVYLSMHEGQAGFLAQHRGGKSKGANRILHIKLHEALGWCECGLELLRGYSGSDDSFVYHENARYRAHLGLIAARRASLCSEPLKQEAGFRRAETTLLDAEAFIIEFPLRDESLSRAIVLLRRAEMKILQQRSRSGFRDLHTHLLNETISPSDVEYDHKDLELSVRMADETWECLERAELLLALHRKNDWWLHLSFVLRVLTAESFCLTYWQWACRQDTMPTWPNPIGSKIKRFLDDGLNKPPSNFGQRDRFFLARVVESALNLKQLAALPRQTPLSKKWVPAEWNSIRRLSDGLLNSDPRGHQNSSTEVDAYADIVTKRIPRCFQDADMR